MPLGAGFETKNSDDSKFTAYRLIYEPSAIPVARPALGLFSCHNDKRLLSLWKHKLEINSLFYQLPSSECFKNRKVPDTTGNTWSSSDDGGQRQGSGGTDQFTLLGKMGTWHKDSEKDTCQELRRDRVLIYGTTLANPTVGGGPQWLRDRQICHADRAWVWEVYVVGTGRIYGWERMGERKREIERHKETEEK